MVSIYSILQALRKRDDDLARELELLRQELERLAKGKSLSGVFTFRHAANPQDGNQTKPT